MKTKCGLMAIALILAGPVFAQLPDAPTPQRSPVQPAPQAQAQTAPKPATQAQAPAPNPGPQEQTIAPKPVLSPAQPVDSAKAAAVRRLMDVTGASRLGDQVATYLVSKVHDGAAPGITPDDRMQKFMADFSKAFQARYKPSEVDDAAVAIYASHLSIEDVQAITQFYESPAGQRMIQELPQILQESQLAGVQIGQKAAMDALRSITTDYPELNEMLPPSDAGAAASPASPSSAAPKTPPSAAPAPAPAPGRATVPKTSQPH